MKTNHSKICKDDNDENKNNVVVVVVAESYLVNFYLDHATPRTSFAECQAVNPNLCNIIWHMILLSFNKESKNVTYITNKFDTINQKGVA